MNVQNKERTHVKNDLNMKFDCIIYVKDMIKYWKILPT